MGFFDKLFGKNKDKEFIPPVPKWQPDLPLDVEQIFEKAKFYTGSKLQLALLKNGTVVIFPKPVTDIKTGAIETINKILFAHPDFKPMAMDDGNFLISYSAPAFTIVFKEEIDANWEYIDHNHLDGVCPAEVLINGQGQRNVFDRVGKICLFGRAKMFLDAQSPQVVKMFNP
jgi:hypothetical protein